MPGKRGDHAGRCRELVELRDQIGDLVRRRQTLVDHGTCDRFRRARVRAKVGGCAEHRLHDVDGHVGGSELGEHRCEVAPDVGTRAQPERGGHAELEMAGERVDSGASSTPRPPRRPRRGSARRAATPRASSRARSADRTDGSARTARRRHQVAQVVVAQVDEAGHAERRARARHGAPLARGVDHLGVDVDAEPVADP